MRAFLQPELPGGHLHFAIATRRSRGFLCLLVLADPARVQAIQHPRGPPPSITLVGGTTLKATTGLDQTVWRTHFDAEKLDHGLLLDWKSNALFSGEYSSGARCSDVRRPRIRYSTARQSSTCQEPNWYAGPVGTANKTEEIRKQFVFACNWLGKSGAWNRDWQQHCDTDAERTREVRVLKAAGRFGKHLRINLWPSRAHPAWAHHAAMWPEVRYSYEYRTRIKRTNTMPIRSVLYEYSYSTSATCVSLC